ncbi:MAG TPA: hypothetical protein VFM28_11145 [Nitrososphaeraceae archaeon]|nr:hypothetical protein [Nitrososphaeraceae archaeon]
MSKNKDQNDEQSSSSLSRTATDDWKEEYGRINKAMILKYVDTNTLNNSIFYICGPPSMLKAMQILLQEDLKIPKESKLKSLRVTDMNIMTTLH